MTKKKQHNGSLTGFSLLELLTAIGIIGILMVIAIPSIIAWLPNLRLKADARQLISSLQKARLEAVKLNKCVGIVFMPAVSPALGGSYLIFIDDGRGMGTACDSVRNETMNNINPALVPPLDSVTMSPGVALTAAAIGGGRSFSFNSRGVIRGSQSGHITIQNTNGLGYSAIISPAGNIRLKLLP